MDCSVIYILGAGHCGSTLLNISLDQHSQIVGVSEIYGLNRDQRRYEFDVGTPQRAFWDDVANRYEQATGEKFDEADLMPNANPDAEWIRQNRATLEAISAASGKPVIADASKMPERLAGLLSIDGLSVKVIYLVRDPRAIVNSYKRKYKTVKKGARKLRRIDRDAMQMRARIPEGDWLDIRYEDLATDTNEVMDRICRFAGLAPEAQTAEPQSENFLGIGGNRLRKKPIEEVKLDEKWKKAMPVWEKLAVSGVFAGYCRRNHYPLVPAL